jgi:hypothetical protein
MQRAGIRPNVRALALPNKKKSSCGGPEKKKHWSGQGATATVAAGNDFSKTIQRGPAAQASWFLPLCVAQAFPVFVQAANPEERNARVGNLIYGLRPHDRCDLLELSLIPVVVVSVLVAFLLTCLLTRNFKYFNRQLFTVN